MSNLSRALIAAALATTAATPLVAQGRPIQLSLFSPVQIVPEDRAVTAVRLNILYTRNTAVRLVDLGLGYNRTTGGPSSGIQWALVSWNDGTFSGWQSGLVAINKGRFVGLQSGGYTSAVNGEGLQWGWVNTAEYRTIRPRELHAADEGPADRTGEHHQAGRGDAGAPDRQLVVLTFRRISRSPSGR